ncbi:DUF4843 domain-containing protein [Gaetbulibacter saemankumensis]|uniref:DUF4843 domain-containing protein n=1 Tax=Gaetbulibacter saemankumensis TaxID=311208 RepID=UPI00042202EB|nr:DUF4843 domain-containing protein [Gaetbulibacter saemankumensis]
MKKYINQLFLALTLCLSFIACEEREIDTFKGNDNIFFKWALDGRFSSTNKVDSVAFSFGSFLPDITKDTFKIPVQTQGFVYDIDREYSIEILEESTAQEGVHFSLPSSFVIPANSIIDSLPIYLMRTADMKEETFSIKIGLVPNENFDANLDGSGLNAETGEPISYNTFELAISDILIKPTYWPFPMLDYSTKKFYLYAEVNNIPLPDWNTENPLRDPTFFTKFFSFQGYLREQINAGTPVLEDDGTPMTVFGI